MRLKFIKKGSLKLTLFIILLSPFLSALHAQNVVPDSTETALKWRQRKAFKIAAAPLAFSMIGLSTLMVEKHAGLSKYRLQEEFLEHPYWIDTNIEDQFRNTPIALVYGLNLLGIKGKNKFAERTILLAKSLLIQHILVSAMKQGFNVERPDGGNFSFPSSHTARAFAAATFMHYEYKDKSPWYSVGAYSIAAATGVLRMCNNHHWFPDVLVGAGIGILSTNIAYQTHQYKWTKHFEERKKRGEMVVLPTYSQRSAGLYFSYKF